MGGFKSIKLTVKPIGVKWNYLNLLIFNYEQRAPSSIKNAEIKKAPAELRCKTGGYGQFPCFPHHRETLFMPFMLALQVC